MCKLPDDRELVVAARQAAARFLSAHGGLAAAPDPAAWHPELLSLVFAGGALQQVEGMLSEVEPPSESD